MRPLQAKFHLGQVICHRLFDYRGIVVDVDAMFQGNDDWYDQVAKPRPPKDKPWYRVLVHEVDHETYVAECNLEPDLSGDPIRTPMINAFFTDLDDTGYQLRYRHN